MRQSHQSEVSICKKKKRINTRIKKGKNNKGDNWIYI